MSVTYGDCEPAHIALASVELSHALVHRTMEATMHGSFDRPGESGNRMQPSWNIGFFAFPILLVIALIGLVLAQPAASRWISEAVQAEFGGGNLTPEIAPVQLAEPTMQIRTVKAY
jgi:hypothetical protein